jgi:hypothetical protein
MVYIGPGDGRIYTHNTPHLNPTDGDSKFLQNISNTAPFHTVQKSKNRININNDSLQKS